jgi:hypothetical protein
MRCGWRWLTQRREIPNSCDGRAKTGSRIGHMWPIQISQIGLVSPICRARARCATSAHPSVAVRSARAGIMASHGNSPRSCDIVKQPPGATVMIVGRYSVQQGISRVIRLAAPPLPSKS